jgi:peptidoglycan/xylan/chitin deacetylase (PgdA/CDA1 family)
MKKIISLMYHDVYKNSPDESGIVSSDCATYKVSEVVFEQHLKAIRQLIDNGRINASDIRLTFDDGGNSFYKIIMPLLEKYDFVGYFFIATNFLGKSGFLSNEMVKILNEHGHVVGAHSHSHLQRMHTLSYDTLYEDWGKSIDILTSITGKPITDVSLPNGYQSKNIIKAVLANGVKNVYTSNPIDTIKNNGSYIEYGRYAVRNGMTAANVVDLIIDNKLRFKLKLRFKFLGIAKKFMGKSYLWIRKKLLG